MHFALKKKLRSLILPFEYLEFSSLVSYVTLSHLRSKERECYKCDVVWWLFRCVYMGVGRCFMLGGPTTLYSACSKSKSPE